MYLFPGELDHDGNRQVPWMTMLLMLACLGFSFYAQWMFTAEEEDIRKGFTEKSQAVDRYFMTEHNDVMGKLQDMLLLLQTQAGQQQLKARLEDVRTQKNEEWRKFGADMERQFRVDVVYNTLGYSPLHFSALPTHLFTHQRTFHLFVVVLFLFLLGAKVEAVWGRLYLLLVFFFGGILGAFVQEQVSGIHQPVVGAFPAVSALLGAGLGRSPTETLNFVYTRFRGKEIEPAPFSLPLYLIGAAWVNVLLLFSLLRLDASAYVDRYEWPACLAAAVGGGLLALVGRYLIGRETEAAVAAAVSGEVAGTKGGSYKQHPSYVTALQAQRDGQIDQAIQLLGTLSEIYPNESGPSLDAYGLHVLQRDRENAVGAMRRAAALALKLQDEELSVRCYKQLVKDYPAEVFLPDDQFKVAAIFEKRGIYNEAIMAYKGVYDRYPQEAVAVKALYKHAEICLTRLNTPQLTIALVRKARQLSQNDPYWKDSLDRLEAQAKAALEGEGMAPPPQAG